MTVQTIEPSTQAQQIMPTGWTFLKAFWSTTWRCVVYSIPFLLPFYIQISSDGKELSEIYPVFYVIYSFIAGAFSLFIGMRKLNQIIYKQDNNLVSIKISPESILFYLFLVNIPYLIEMIISYVCFVETNVWLMLLFGIILDLFIFYRMMTKDIMGFKMTTWKLIRTNSLS